MRQVEVNEFNKLPRDNLRKIWYTISNFCPATFKVHKVHKLYIIAQNGTCAISVVKIFIILTHGLRFYEVYENTIYNYKVLTHQETNKQIA